MSNLNASSGFMNGMARGNKISILAFEVANTVVKGANLLQSLSEENILLLKKDILHSQGVQLLVSTDMNELLSIAAADKRLLFVQECNLLSAVEFYNVFMPEQLNSLAAIFILYPECIFLGHV